MPTDTAALPPLLVNIRDAARLLGVSERTVWQLRHDGRIPAVAIGTRSYRFSVAALRAFAEGQTNETSFSNGHAPQSGSQEATP
jgi:excisionase family DNA binding protein